jgi:type II secretory pathway component GspD/PulD (secretin)
MRYIICFLIIVTLAFNGFSATAANGSAAASKEKRAEAYFAQGYLYYLEKSYNEAVPEFVKALRLEPSMIKARYWMGKAYYQLGNYESAVNQCSAALAVTPNYKDAKNLRDQALKKLGAKAKIPLKKSAVRSPGPVVPPTVVAATKEAVQVIAEKTAEVAPVAVTVVKTRSKIKSDQKEKKRLISLDLRNVDISSVLQIFSKETGISIIAGRDVYGKVTVILNNVTPEDALDIILKSNGYTYTRQGNVVQVYSSTEPARVEELPGGVFVRTFMINYVGPDELLATLTKLMPENANIYTTQGSKTVIVKGSANDIRRAEILIRNLDIPPRQVMVEARIIEVSLNESQSMGINSSWTNPDNATEIAQTKGLANQPTVSGATGLYYSVTNQNMTSLVETLSTRTGFNILSSPKVMALNEQKAEIITGSRLGYKTKTVTTTGMIESVEFLDVGTKLVITPSIKSDGLIVMEIHPEISEGAIVNDLPQKNSTETTTQLIVKDGQTIVIGGLIRDSQKKEVKGVPVLMDIPLLGSLLKRTDIISEKKEVIVLITPHIINSKYLIDMEGKAADMEQRKKDTTPSMPLDLLR